MWLLHACVLFCILFTMPSFKNGDNEVKCECDECSMTLCDIALLLSYLRLTIPHLNHNGQWWLSRVCFSLQNLSGPDCIWTCDILWSWGEHLCYPALVLHVQILTMYDKVYFDKTPNYFIVRDWVNLVLINALFLKNTELFTQQDYISYSLLYKWIIAIVVNIENLFL